MDNRSSLPAVRNGQQLAPLGRRDLRDLQRIQGAASRELIEHDIRTDVVIDKIQHIVLGRTRLHAEAMQSELAFAEAALARIGSSATGAELLARHLDALVRDNIATIGNAPWPW